MRTKCCFSSRADTWPPSNIYQHVGDTVEIYCVLDDSSMAKGLTSANLSFSTPGRNISKFVQVSAHRATSFTFVHFGINFYFVCSTFAGIQFDGNFPANASDGRNGREYNMSN